jgi:aldose 1-epimerase
MARLSCDAVIQLRSGPYTARIAPAAGGRIGALTWSRGATTVPLLVEWDGSPFDEHDWPKAGAFPMLPFANRLPREGFVFGGRQVQPEAGSDGFPLHGVAHRREWSVAEQSAHRVVIRFMHEAANACWPWPWTAEQEISLGADGLTVKLTMRNDSSETMPGAMGWHPYHPVREGMTDADVSFAATARRQLDGDGRAGEQDHPPVFATAGGGTAAFTGWKGEARVPAHVAGAVAIRSRGADVLVLHRPTSGGYVCIEPVTLLPGKLAVASPLQPGESRALTWTCSYVAADGERP